MIHSDTSLAQTCWIERVVGSTVEQQVGSHAASSAIAALLPSVYGPAAPGVQAAGRSDSTAVLITLPIPDRRCWGQTPRHGPLDAIGLWLPERRFQNDGRQDQAASRPHQNGRQRDGLPPPRLTAAPLRC